jgi:hypothetical protein|tara:strand:- start:1477 stop:1677 length:201 start_codon:yes stop_codon:yes gene_type:complete
MPLDLSTENFPDALRKMLREKMNDHSDALVGGSCQDFSDYRYMCGIIAGLALAERDLLDLLERGED